MNVFVLLLFLLFGIIAFGSIIIWIWALIDCVNNEPSEGNDKIIWVLVIVLAQLIGAIIYLVVRRPQRKETLGR